MKFIEWSDQYNINIRSIDEQHKHLTELINELALAKFENRDREIHGKILFEVVNYTKIHFAAEEEYMRKINYPHILEHEAQHKILIKQIVDILNGYKGGHHDITDAVLEILKNWLLKHVLKQDKEITLYLHSKHNTTKT